MGEQLDLFGCKAVRPAEPVVVAHEAEGTPAAETPTSLPGQMDLFGDRWLRASAAHKALESFDLDAAADALRDAVQLYPADAALFEQSKIVAKLAKSLRVARRKKDSFVEALAAIENQVPDFLKTIWHRCLAEGVEKEGASGAVLGGIPAGIHWLRAGEASRAEESLRATLAADPSDCRALGYLGDALTAQDREAEARIAYRDALAASPSDVDLVNMLDSTVRDLASLAQDEYELVGTPAEWVAAVGLIEGVFIPPSHVPQDWVDATVLDRLPRGLRFYRWLVAEKVARNDADRIACRRAMKTLSPRLLKELLNRRR